MGRSVTLPCGMVLHRRVPVEPMLEVAIMSPCLLGLEPRVTLASCVSDLLLFSMMASALRNRAQQEKGRELVAPPQEAPRSAHPENTPSRARWARAGGLSSGFEYSRFSCEAGSRSYAKVVKLRGCLVSSHLLLCWLPRRLSRPIANGLGWRVLFAGQTAG